MKKLFLFMMAAAMVTFAGCQKNELEGTDASKTSTISLIADIDQGSAKTTLDGKNVEWETGDIIYAVTTDGAWGAPFDDDNSGETIAEFTYDDGTFTTAATLEDGDYLCKVLYASSSQKSYHRGESTSHKLQSTQNQDCSAPTAHIKTNDALVGEFEASVPSDEPFQVTMAHLYTMMQVDVKNNTGAAIQVTRFEMSATDANLAGVFNVDDFNVPSISLKTSASDKITVNLTGGNVAAGATLPVYFVMAPLADYAGDVTFKVTDSEGNTYSKTVTMNGITFAAGKYNTTPYTIKDADEITGVPLPFTETFATGLGEFTSEGVLPSGLSYIWSHDSGYKCAKASAYVSGTRYEQINYLVSPVLDLTGVESAKMTFDHAGNYFSGTESSSANVCVREVGGDWDTLNIPTYFTSWTFVNSGDIDLSAYVGKYIQIGFKYSSSSSVAGTWEIKNLEVSEGASATEIIVAAVPETVGAEGAEVSVAYSITNPKEGKSLTASANVAWITAFDYSTAGQVKFAVAANESTEARSGVVTLSYDGAESVNVTVNQKGQAVAGSSEVIIVFADLGYENGAAVESVSSEPVTVTFDQGTNGSNAPKYYTTGSAVRTYGGNNFTIAVSSGNIVGIELTYASGEGTNAITSDVGVFSGNVWSGSAQSVTLTIGGTTGHRRIQKIKVSYISGGAVPEPEPKTLESIAVENPKTEYTVGDQFVAPTVKATYSDATIATVTGATFSGYDMATAGTQTVTVSYTEGEVTKTTTYSISVNPNNSDYTGTYAIVAYRTSDNYYYYLTNQDAGAKTKRLVATVIGTSKPENGVSVPESKLWKLKKSATGYVIQSVETEQYVSWISDNSALMADEKFEFTVTENEGQYTFVNGDRYLSLNSSKGSDYFAMYTGSQTHDLYLIPAVEGEEVKATVESIEVTGYTQEFTQNSEFSFGGKVTATLSNGVTVDVTSESEFTGYDMSVVGPQTVTVTYTKDGKTVSTTYNIMVSKAQGGAEAYYVKVTSAPADWSGEYLLVAKNNADLYALDQKSTGSWGTASSVTETTSGIVANNVTNAYKIIISAGTVSGTYSLQLQDNNYVSSSAAKKFNVSVSKSASATDMKISLNGDGTVTIESKTKAGRKLHYNYNNGSGGFRYYDNNTSLSLPYLYKLQN